MKKQTCKSIFSMALCFLLVVCLFSACATTVDKDKDGNGTNGDGKNGTGDGVTGADGKSTLGGFLTGLGEADFTVDKDTDLTENEYGAKYGKRFNVNGTQMEVYEYGETIDEKFKEMVNNARESGEMEINGEKRKVLFNGNYMITGYDKHPDLDKIEEYFKGYKMK